MDEQRPEGPQAIALPEDVEKALLAIYQNGYGNEHRDSIVLESGDVAEVARALILVAGPFMAWTRGVSLQETLFGAEGEPPMGVLFESTRCIIVWPEPRVLATVGNFLRRLGFVGMWVESDWTALRFSFEPSV